MELPQHRHRVIGKRPIAGRRQRWMALIGWRLPPNPAGPLQQQTPKAQTQGSGREGEHLAPAPSHRLAGA